MPLYEYKCRKCGKIFEALQKFSDEPVSVHAECGGEVERLISAPAFHLKGTGWYATDYAKKNGSGTKSEESKEAKEAKEAKEKSDGDKADSTKAKPDADSSKPAAESKPAAPSSSDSASKSE